MARRKPLAERIREHNDLQTAPAARIPRAQQVQVKIAGRYLGPDRRAVQANAGDIIGVLGGDYAQSLVDDGLAAWPAKQASKRTTKRGK